MHRTNHMPRLAYGLILLGVMLGRLATAGVLLAQEAAAPTPQGTVIVPIGGTRPLQMKGKQDISTPTVQREGIVTVIPSTDRKTVLIRGVQAGRTTVTLVADDAARTEETYEIIVQLDTEMLQSALKQVAPTANVQLHPVGGQGTPVMLVLAGTVAHADDINVILRIAENMMGVGRVINNMHVGGVQQVQLDVAIARVSRTKIRHMSFEFLNFGQHHFLSSQTGGAVNIPSGPLTGPVGSPTILNTITPPNPNPGVFLGLFNASQELYTFLQILKTEQVGKLLAEPKLITSSGKSATFQDGGTFYLAATGGLNATAPLPVQFGTRLTFLPIVLGNGRIYLEVEPDVSSVIAQIPGSTGPSLARQQVRTSVEMEDGQTFVIGGLIQNTRIADITKIPVLGDLPYIGAAFSTKNDREEETELIVLVTPHLVDPVTCNQLPKLLPGQETRSPDDFELFLENILEAPRGQRDVCIHKKYVPAWKHSPSAAQFPCGRPEPQPPLGKGCVSHGCCGSGLAETTGVSYSNSNGTTQNGEAKPTAEMGRREAALLPPVELSETANLSGETPATPAASDAKPASLFGPNGYNPR